MVSGSCPFSPSGAAGYTSFCPLNGRAERLRPLASTGLTTAIVIRVDMTTTATQAALDALMDQTRTPKECSILLGFAEEAMKGRTS